MKTLFAVFVCFISVAASAQYYYKDIVGTKESADLISTYQKNKVKLVVLKSYTINNTPLDNLSIQQEFSPAQKTLRTITKTGFLEPSYLTTYFDASGRITKTIDSAGDAVKTTIYNYNGTGLLTSIVTTYGDSLATLKSDEHIWQYDAQNRISRMLRVKNKQDTTVVNFKWDAAGNVIEEQETRHFIKDEPVYYYYDNKNRLTDIVRFNKKASRLLPEQMFNYAANNQLVERTTVPQNSDDYLIWRYRFNEQGLKVKEEIYNKQKELTGTVEYQYSFSN